MCRAALAACVASVLVVPVASGGASADPNALRLATALKRSMQSTYRTTVPGLAFGRVTCTLGANPRNGRCKARFTYPAREFDGVYQVTASIDRRGGVRWRATSVACTSIRTGKKVAC
jgi:hypothetical protein